MTIMKRLHVFITGRVQGVFFRARMQREAKALGFTGWVRNLPDGRVEAILEGEANNRAAMLAWCHEGPPGALVNNVEVLDEPYSGDYQDFTIRY